MEHRLHRFQKSITQIIILVSGFWFLVSVSYAQPVSSSELINQAKQYDGKTVIYTGEVIGEVMPRGDFAWVNVHDGKTAIGIWINRDLAKEILYTGSYDAQGDKIEASGVFHRACPEHGGDTDIHAEKIMVLERGKGIIHPIDPQKIKTSITLAAIVLVLAIIHLIARRFR